MELSGFHVKKKMFFQDLDKFFFSLKTQEKIRVFFELCRTQIQNLYFRSFPKFILNWTGKLYKSLYYIWDVFLKHLAFTKKKQNPSFIFLNVLDHS